MLFNFSALVAQYFMAQKLEQEGCSQKEEMQTQVEYGLLQETCDYYNKIH